MRCVQGEKWHVHDSNAHVGQKGTASFHVFVSWRGAVSSGVVVRWSDRWKQQVAAGVCAIGRYRNIGYGHPASRYDLQHALCNEQVTKQNTMIRSFSFSEQKHTKVVIKLDFYINYQLHENKSNKKAI